MTFNYCIVLYAEYRQCFLLFKCQFKAFAVMLKSDIDLFFSEILDGILGKNVVAPFLASVIVDCCLEVQRLLNHSVRQTGINWRVKREWKVLIRTILATWECECYSSRSLAPWISYFIEEINRWKQEIKTKRLVLLNTELKHHWNNRDHPQWKKRNNTSVIFTEIDTHLIKIHYNRRKWIDLVSVVVEEEWLHKIQVNYNVRKFSLACHCWEIHNTRSSLLLLNVFVRMLSKSYVDWYVLLHL